MIYLFTNDYMCIHYLYEDGYIYVHNERDGIYKKWLWGNLMGGTIDIPKFDAKPLPEKLNFVTIDGGGHNDFIDVLSKYIEQNIFEKLL